MDDTVLYEVDGPLATITLNRPEQRNAIDPETSHAVAECVRRLDAEPGVRVGILTGAGPVFCAGADLKAVAAGRLREIIDLPGGFCGLVAAERRTPLIAAVNGHALAGGCELALACDMVVADEKAQFGLPEVSRGIIAGAGGLFRLAHAIPPKRAMELILTADRMTAEEAHGYGLVNQVAPAGQALGLARALARRVAENSPIAVRESRTLVQQATEHAGDTLWQGIAEAWERVLASPDALEGSRAFAERRAPAWSDAG
ncbi:MAG: enoyl-CoA hydratase [Solirubrobacteraceae bacterium]|jgi:enoyl-CoA hydratase|nr:enoyl-CoA hydratase [Solirubrobacteraceae bacterium]